MLEDLYLIFLKDLKTKLCKYNKKEVESVYCREVYEKGVLKIDFIYVKIHM